MKKGAVVLAAVLCVICVFSFTACDAAYKKGVKIDDYPEKDVPIYDDAIVFSYEIKGDKCKIKYGSKDDVDDIMEFYREEFEDEDYHIYGEDIDKDEYSVEGIIDDIAFEIDVEQARGDKEEKYFDTVVAVEIIFDSNDYDEDGAASEDDSVSEKNVKPEEDSSSAMEGGGSVSSEQSDESDEAVKVKAISDILVGQTHTSKEGFITVEFGAVEIDSSDDGYLHIEYPLTITNNSDAAIFVTIKETWTNGLVLGTCSNCVIPKGETSVLQADMGAAWYGLSDVSEIADMFFYITVMDEECVQTLDTAQIEIINPGTQYVQKDISNAPVLKATDEVTVTYSGYYNDGYYDNLVFYVTSADKNFSPSNTYTIFLSEFVIDGVTLEDTSYFYGEAYGGGEFLMRCFFPQSESEGLFEGDEFTIDHVLLNVMDANYNHAYYDIEGITFHTEHLDK